MTVNLLQKATRLLSRNSPLILTSLSVVGVSSTAILAVRATPKAMYLIDKYKNQNNIPDISKLEAVKLTWKCYVPAASVGLVTSICIIAAHRVSMRRSAALATLYSLTETTFKEYQDAVEETLGKKKEKWIRDQIDKNHLKNNPPKQNEIVITGNGSVLVYDALSGRYFASDIEKIRKAINEVNHDLMTSNYITLNEMYSKLGLEDISLGENLGWDIERGLIEPRFSSQLTQDEKPCLVLNFKVFPIS